MEKATDPAVVILTSCPSADVAAEIAATLVEERLAACVTQLPGARSTYRWQGRLTTDEEVLCVIKTARDRADAVLARLPALHPYEVPEGIVIEVTGSLPPYLAWLFEVTR